ncbi:MAG TPA: hypothetical protein VJ917_03895 [Saprospiraceae bacterium]|nr:hypothetical protein [Saprospiraceae bacterium]
MQLKYSYLILMLLVGGSCQTKQESKWVEGALPEDFTDFYDRFHSDSLYQMEHISFPLSGIPALQMQQLDSLYYFKKQNWRLHRAIPDSAIAYQSIEEIDEGIIEEEIGLTENRVAIFRRYSKIGDEWYLIYYMAPNYIKRQ